MEALIAKASTPEMKALVVKAHEIGVREEKLTNKAIKEGKYFTPIDKIWSPLPFKFNTKKAANGDAFKNFGRTKDHWKKAPMYDALGVLTSNKMLSPNLDNKTKKKAIKKGRTGMVSDSESAGSGSGNASSVAASGASEKTAGSFRRFHVAGKKPCSRAHLIPEAQPYQRVHGIMGQAVFGLYPEEETKENFTTDECILASQQLVCGVKDSKTGGQWPGLVDMPVNFIQMPANHGPLYDENPCWMVVPILDENEVKEWTGLEEDNETKKGYWVMLIAGKHSRDNGKAYTDEEAYMPLIDVGYTSDYDRVDGELKREKCQPKDIRKATVVLISAVKAMAETLIGRSGKVSPFNLFDEIGGKASRKPPLPDPNSKKSRLLKVAEHIRQNGVLIPDYARGYDDPNRQVLKVYLDPTLTSVPDPMLLLVKAAITWSDRNNQKLLPACGEDELVPDFIECVPHVVEEDDSFEDCEDDDD